MAPAALLAQSQFLGPAAVSGSTKDVFLTPEDRGVARVVCKKEGIHPKFYTDANVYCNGEMVMTTGGTQPEYVVDVWSGNHPFYQGNKSIIVQEAGRLDRFNKKYGNLGFMSQVPVLTEGEIEIKKKSKGPAKGGRGGKK